MSTAGNASAVRSGLLTAVVLSLVGAGVVLLTSGEVGYALTAAGIGLVIGLAILAVASIGGRRG